MEVQNLTIEMCALLAREILMITQCGHHNELHCVHTARHYTSAADFAAECLGVRHQQHDNIGQE